MDWRWVASLLLVGCFSEPPSTETGDAGSSTGPGGGSSSTSISPTTAPVTSITASGSTTSTGTTTTETTDAAESTSLDSTTEEPPGCVVDEACIPPPPPEWNGPLVGRVVEDALVDPACPPGTDEVFRAGQDPVAPCDCAECSDEGIACDVTVEWGVFGSCNTTTTGTGCQPFDNGESGQLFLAVDVEEAEGSACTSPTPGEVVFRVRAVGCEPPVRSCEDGGTCVPGRACIWQEGEHMCPPEFDTREILYDDFIEKGPLSCDSCGCGSAELPCDQVTLTPYGEGSCGGAPVAADESYFSVNEPNCQSWFDPDGLVFAEDVASVDIQTNPVTCASAQEFAVAIGEIDPVGPRTLCCTE